MDDGRAPAPVRGPGELTLTAVVLFAIGVYAVASGAVSGDEPVVAVGVFAFTCFAVGLVWPIAALAGLEIEAVAPPEATVGDEVRLRVTVRGRATRVEIRVLDPPGQWWRTALPTTGTIAHVAHRRGVFGHVRVQVRTSAPLGVFVRTRQARVPLTTPIEIGPRPEPAAAPLGPLPDGAPAALDPAAGGGGGDTFRAVRPYVPGDAARLVHWASSARRGELVVREHDPPAVHGVAIVLDLRGPTDAAERAASIAAGIARSTFGAGGVVLLATNERTGPVLTPVADVRECNRRLARAVPGEPPTPPAGWPVATVRAFELAAPPAVGAAPAPGRAPVEAARSLWR